MTDERLARDEALKAFRLRARPVMEAVLGLAAYFEQVAAADDALTEATARRDAADADLARAKQELSALREERVRLLETSKAEAAEIIQQAHDQAAIIRAAAKALPAEA